MGSTGKTTVQHYITGLSLFLSPYHFLLATDTATFTAPSLPAFQPFFIHSLQSTHNEPPVIIHSLLRVVVLSLFSIQFIGIYLRLINRGFQLRYVSFLSFFLFFFYLKGGVPQFCSQDTSHVFIQLHWAIPLRTLLQNFRYISNTRSDSSVTFLTTSSTNLCQWRNYHLAICNNVHHLAVCSFFEPSFFTPCFLINMSILHNRLRKFFNCNFMEKSSWEADSCSTGIRSNFFYWTPLFFIMWTKLAYCSLF